MDKTTASKLLDALERVEHGGFGDGGLSTEADDRVPLYLLAVRKQDVMLEEARHSLDPRCPRPEEALEYLTSAVELARLIAKAET